MNYIVCTVFGCFKKNRKEQHKQMFWIFVIFSASHRLTNICDSWKGKLIKDTVNESFFSINEKYPNIVINETYLAAR